MNETTNKLFLDILTFFETMGVKAGVGRDGLLMNRIIEELGGMPTTTSANIPTGTCPVCKATNMLDCDCPPEDQVKALEQR